jgi:hypothetical protein
MLFCVPGVPQTALVNAASRASLPSVELTATRGPREIEDLTRQKILHDYAAAWKTLAAGFEQNRAINEQAGTGIHGVYVDRGHKLEAIFYSPDGGLMQLRDNAEYEIQIFDGAKLLHSETVSVRFLVLMTPAADRWMVRLLQDVPTS